MWEQVNIHVGSCKCAAWRWGVAALTTANTIMNAPRPLTRPRLELASQNRRTSSTPETRMHTHAPPSHTQTTKNTQRHTNTSNSPGQLSGWRPASRGSSATPGKEERRACYVCGVCCVCCVLCVMCVLILQRGFPARAHASSQAAAVRLP